MAATLSAGGRGIVPGAVVRERRTSKSDQSLTFPLDQRRMKGREDGHGPTPPVRRSFITLLDGCAPTPSQYLILSTSHLTSFLLTLSPPSANPFLSRCRSASSVDETVLTRSTRLGRWTWWTGLGT